MCFYHHEQIFIEKPKNYSKEEVDPENILYEQGYHQTDRLYVE